MNLHRIGRSLVVAIAACVVSMSTLTGCGPSVSDAKAEAYQKLDSLSDLDTTDREEFKPRLDSATDKTTIDQVVAEAEARNQEKANDKASKASAGQAEVDKVKSLNLSGKTMTYEGPNQQSCIGLSLRFNEDGSIAQVEEKRGCSAPRSWKIQETPDWNGNAGLYFDNDMSDNVDFDILDDGRIQFTHTPWGSAILLGTWSLS